MITRQRLLRALFQFSQGRLLSLFLLILACLALYRIEDTPLSSLHAAQFDRYQRVMPRVRDQQPVIVVGIDSRSLAEYGQWPWPRDRVAQLLARIQADQPLVVGLDILFPEQDRYSPTVLARQFTSLPQASLQVLPDPDRLLAQALAAAPSVLAVSGQRNLFPGFRQPLQHNHPIDLHYLDPARLLRFPTGSTSLPLLEQSATGQGFINSAREEINTAKEQGVLRSVPTLAMIGAQPFLSLPLEMVRVALDPGLKADLEVGPSGISRIYIGNYSLPTQPTGEVLLHFGKTHTKHYVPATEVLAGKVEPGFFTSRFVIIGFANSGGLTDLVVSPLGERLLGADVHAQVIESLLSGTALQRPHWLPHVELAALGLSGLLLIGIIPALRPRYAIATFIVFAAFWLLAGYTAFRSGRWLFDAAAIVLLLTPVFMTLLSATWIVADRRQREAELALQGSREEAARISGELDAARRIQMGLLPDPAKVFGDERRYEIAALLEPARAVGGDYYDCFAIDARRLCFAIADVSGKGLPASLFMAVAKTLTSALARRTSDLGQAMREIEAELNRENPEFLFVTAFIGVLDIETGQLDFLRAGHDAPLLLRNGQTSRVDAAAASGPPLCALGDFPYQSAQMQLHPGDLLCMFTDGVTEASDGHELFGLERLTTVFLAQAPEIVTARQITAIRDAVRTFEAGHAPADDLTLLLVRWNGPTSTELVRDSGRANER